MLEIHERAGGPEPLMQLLTRDEIAGALHQQCEDVKGLSGKAEAHASLAQFTCVQIQRERAEPDDTTSRPWRFTHWVVPEPSARRGWRRILARRAV